MSGGATGTGRRGGPAADDDQPPRSLLFGSTELTLGTAPADGEFLKRSGSQVIGGTPGGGGVLAPSISLAAAQEAMGWTGLLGNTNKHIRAHWRIKNGTASTVIYQLHLNGATTGITYQRLLVDGTSVTADENANLGGAVAGWITELWLDMRIAAWGHPRNGKLDVVFCDAAGAIQEMRQYAVSWSNTADQVTAIAVDSDNANGCGIGSTAAISEVPS